MTLIRATVCMECDAKLELNAGVCDHCQSTDTFTEAVAAEVDYAQMDREAEKRRENKRYWDRMYAGMDFFVVARDLTVTDVDTATVPAIRMLEKQAS